MLAPGLRAAPEEDANVAFVTLWNSMRRVVALESRPGLPHPLLEQRVRLRTELVPMLELDLKHDVEHWLEEVDRAIDLFREHHFHRLSEVIAFIVKRRRAERTNPGFRSRWMSDPAAKKLKFWLPLQWDPLMLTPERPVVEGDELLVMLGFRLEPVTRQAFGWSRRERLWWTVRKAADQEAVEMELARRTASRQVEAVYRKVTLVATLRERADRWIIERLEWLDRPPGR